MSLDYLERVFKDLQNDINFLRNSKNEDAKWAVKERLRVDIEMIVANIEFLQRQKTILKGA